jgi:hypothetical protein
MYDLWEKKNIQQSRECAQKLQKMKLETPNEIETAREGWPSISNSNQCTSVVKELLVYY